MENTKSVIEQLIFRLRENGFKIEAKNDDFMFFSKDGISFTLDVEKSLIVNLWIEYINIDEYALCYNLNNNEVLFADFSNFDFVVSTALEEIISILDNINIQNKNYTNILIKEVI